MKTDDCIQQATELFQEEAIRNAKKPTKDTSQNTHCLYCKEPVERGRAYCDEDCRADHEFVKERKAHTRRA